MCDKEKWKKKKKEKGLSYNYDLNQISFIFKKKRKKEFQIHCFLFATIKNIFFEKFPHFDRLLRIITIKEEDRPENLSNKPIQTKHFPFHDLPPNVMYTYTRYTPKFHFSLNRNFRRVASLLVFIFRGNILRIYKIVQNLRKRITTFVHSFGSNSDILCIEKDKFFH